MTRTIPRPPLPPYPDGWVDSLVESAFKWNDLKMKDIRLHCSTGGIATNSSRARGTEAYSQGGSGVHRMLALKHMSNEPNHTVERLRFREHYRSLTDDDLARLSMDENLVPAARQEITEELQVRGLRDLSSFRKRFAEEATVSGSEGFIGVLPREQKDLQLFGATVLRVWV